jgi:hypothetical protein
MHSGISPSFSSAIHKTAPIVSWRRLLRQVADNAEAFTWLIAGSSKPARTATMEITTSSSINVKARSCFIPLSVAPPYDSTNCKVAGTRCFSSHRMAAIVSFSDPRMAPTLDPIVFRLWPSLHTISRKPRLVHRLGAGTGFRNRTDLTRNWRRRHGAPPRGWDKQG